MACSKKRLLIGMLMLMIMVLPSVGLAGSQDFTLVNDSPIDIVGLWVAPANSDNWEENLLEGAYLPAGYSVPVTFDNSNNVQWWNIKIEDSNGKMWRWENKDYDLTQISEITFRYKGSNSATITYK